MQIGINKKCGKHFIKNLKSAEDILILNCHIFITLDKKCLTDKKLNIKKVQC